MGGREAKAPRTCQAVTGGRRGDKGGEVSESAWEGSPGTEVVEVEVDGGGQGQAF